MLSAAKHLCAYRDRPFASLRVTSEGSCDERFPSGRSQVTRAYDRSCSLNFIIGSGAIVLFTFVIRIAEQPARADKSAVGAINDSVGKLCTDKLTSAGTRQDPAFAAREAAYSSSACEEQGHETRGRSKDCCSFPLHMQVLLIMLGPSFAERRCTDMLTKFTNRVINRPLRMCHPRSRYPEYFVKVQNRPLRSIAGLIC